MEPLLAPWTGEHGGFPRFDLVKIDDFKDALTKGMELQRAEIGRIAAQSEAPSFENTIAAYQDCGRPLGRALSFFDIYTSAAASKEMQSIESGMRPVLAQFGDEIIQNEALFQRIRAVYNVRASVGLTPEQQRLTEVLYKNFARNGAGLGVAEKARLKEINRKLSTLYTDFSHNLLAEEESGLLVLESEADLAGLSDELCESAAAQAAARNLKGKWVITNTRSSMEPFLTFSSRRDLREKGWRMWTSRCESGAHGNKAIIAEILKLRSERARILGFPTHAHWMLDENMAKTPDAAMDLMTRVWKAAVDRVHREVADMQAIADAEGVKIAIEPWDYRYYAEKLRKAQYDIDQNEVKKYLQLDKIREGMFWAAGQVYGIEMVKVEGLPVMQSRCHRLRSAQRRQADRAVVFRSLRPRRQEIRRLDERIPHPGKVPRRSAAHRLQQREFRERQAGRAGAHFMGRCDERCFTNSATRCMAFCPASIIRRWPGQTFCTISSSFRARSTSAG